MLSNPKDFYRKLDAFLSEIYQVGSENIIAIVLTELVNFLGKDLRIQNGRLYELDVENFVLLHHINLENIPESIQTLQLDNEAVQLVLLHGCYIYNEPRLISMIRSGAAQLTPAAFYVQKEEHVWLFVFELLTGWEREEIDFSLNTIRKVLTARISSETFRNYLHQAELIQRSLLPKKSPKIEGFDIAGKSISTDIVGGDLYDYIEYDSETFGVAVGDASGHGLPAALVVRDVVTGLRMGLEREMKLTKALEKLNRVIHRSSLSTSFISLFYCEIETDGTVVYSNAGHPPPLLVSGDESQMLDRGGFVLGPLPEVKLKRGFAMLNPGNSLILYSDGILERQNRYGIPFEMERLRKFVMENQHLSADELMNLIIKTVYNFGGKSKWKDDATVVVVKRLK
ncbi:MAG: PP2C family protein-serine/threonine phosphatase [bacterium]|jgi:sigma-B regulation protein RsbU (phosphoserine phosphatase)|nr:PP2C family protein-serine/threonine phosphatase [bacterium]